MATNRTQPVIVLLSLMCWTLFQLSAQGLTVTTNGYLSVIEGGTVTLSCTYSPRMDPNVFGALSWQMGDGTRNVFISYTCGRTCNLYNSDPARFTLDVDLMFSGNFTISNVRLEDDRQYKCAVVSSRGSAFSMVQLVVTVPPASIQIYDGSSPGGYPSGAQIQVMSGQSHTVTCKINPGAKPQAQLQWNGGGVVIYPGGQDNSAIVGSRLTMSSRAVSFTPSITDHQRQLRCTATHPALQAALETYVQLDVQVPPSQVQIEYNSTIIQSGEVTITQDIQSTITCKSVGTRPSSVIVWYFDNAEVSMGVMSFIPTANTDNNLLYDTSSSIVIQPSREDHGKTLRCQATAAGMTVSESVTLAVEGPPDAPTIDTGAGTFVEEQTSTVRCMANNGHPAPAFVWNIGGRDLTGDAQLAISVSANNRIDATSQLTYRPLREDNGLQLECSVLHPTLKQPLVVQSDILNIDYCPSSIVITVCPQVLEGTSKTLVCQSGASNPPAALVWTRGVNMISDSDTVQETQPSTDPLGTTTTLSYTRIFTRDDDMKDFICCATASNTCRSNCSQPCRPDVQYPPTSPVLQRSNYTDPIPEGTTNLEITCRAEGNPEPALVWIYVENPGLMLDQVMQTDGSSILRFMEVRRGNAGVYRCIANNDIDPTSQSDTNLVVSFPPTIINEADNRAAANEGETATLTCISDANPASSVRWYNSTGGLITRSERIIIENMPESDNIYKTRTVSNLRILGVIPNIDHGDYKCVMENDLGVDELAIHLNGTSKPEPPIRVQVNSSQTTAHSLLVTWQPGFDGGVEQFFIIKYCINGTSGTCRNITNIRGAEHIIDTLEAFTWYRISVLAENTNGRSVVESELLAPTAPLPPSGYGLQVTLDKGVVTLTPDPNVIIPNGICFKIQPMNGAPCSPTSPCYQAGDKIQRSVNEQIVVVSYAGAQRLCSVPEKTEVKRSSGRGPKSTATGAIVGTLVLVALIAVVIFFVKRSHDRRKEGATKLANSGKRTGPDGKSSDKNGQTQPFLSGGYCAYNPVYDDVPKEESDRNSNSHIGRVVNEDGLIYAEVSHFREHPDGKPPIRTEEATIYADLDFKRMKEEEKDENSSKPEEDAQKESLIYENITPPMSP